MPCQLLPSARAVTTGDARLDPSKTATDRSATRRSSVGRSLSTFSTVETARSAFGVEVEYAICQLYMTYRVDAEQPVRRGGGVVLSFLPSRPCARVPRRRDD